MKHSSDEPLQTGESAEQVDSASDAASTAATTDIAKGKDWQLWPPSPKVQIVLIAMGFGLFNLILLAIWALVMVYRF